MRFTDRSIRVLKPKTERHEIWENGRTGLGVRVSTRGRLSWVYMYRFEGRPRRMTLGVYPKMGLAAARLAHAGAKKLLDDGTDPGTQHVEQRRAERKAETVSDLIEEYLERHARPYKKTAAEDERALRKEVEPEWGGRKAKSITRRDVVTLLDVITDRGSPVMRNRLSSLIGRVFSFAVERGIRDTTPCVGIRPLKELPRDRVLSPDEIRTLWQGLDSANMTLVTRLALRFLLVTGQRRQEVTGARRSEIDAEQVWEIPAERTKNGRTHRVPLPPMAGAMLDEIDRLREMVSKGSKGEPSTDAPLSEWLFPSPRTGRPITPGSVTMALRNNLSGMGLAKITPHDFRRTCATTMTKLGISQFIVARVLNHTDQTITGRVYDKNEYLPQKEQALAAWARRLEEIISGETPADETVVPLRLG